VTKGLVSIKETWEVCKRMPYRGDISKERKTGLQRKEDELLMEGIVHQERWRGKDEGVQRGVVHPPLLAAVEEAGWWSLKKMLDPP